MGRCLGRCVGERDPVWPAVVGWLSMFRLNGTAICNSCRYACSRLVFCSLGIATSSENSKTGAPGSSSMSSPMTTRLFSILGKRIHAKSFELFRDLFRVRSSGFFRLSFLAWPL